MFRDLLEQTGYYLDNMGGTYDLVSSWFDGYFVDTEGSYDPIYDLEDNRRIASELTNNYLVPRYYNWAIGYYDETKNVEQAETIVNKHFIYKWWMIMKATFGKYAPLINMYRDKETALLANIKQTGISRYNDTPQDGGDWSDDQHTTNISTTETSTEGASTAVRLAEVRAMWENLYSEWAAEFKGLFIWIGEIDA
ncbi:MAG: hypothetical protein J6R32_10915 [Bacteroidales bacterium]|nr:hypothetical protein [Bacteroidales bacterium]